MTYIIMYKFTCKFIMYIAIKIFEINIFKYSYNIRIKIIANQINLKISPKIEIKCFLITF